MLVDGPCTGVGRVAINLKQLHLTKFVLNIEHSTRTKNVRKAWEKEEITQKWDETTWAKKLAAREKVRLRRRSVRSVCMSLIGI